MMRRTVAWFCFSVYIGGLVSTLFWGDSSLLIAWAGSGFWYPLLGSILCLPLLLFPTGLLSRRWRPVLWLALAPIAVVTVVENFSSRLREDVDLDHIALELLGEVRNAMQPAHVSVWLRS